MGNYAEKQDCLYYGFQPGPQDEDFFNTVLPRASRIVDELCGVDNDYFAAAGASPTERRFDGTGTRYLKIPPYVAGSITSLTYDSGAAPPSYAAVDGLLRANRGEYWRFNDEVIISARWGFSAIPEEIKEATIEIAIAIWRGRDTGFARVTAEVNGSSIVTPAIPDRAKLICQKWEEKTSFIFA